jgi:PAS domain-containing protein
MPESRSSIDIDDGRALTQAIFDTVREPLLVLDKDLRVVAASRSFYPMFQVSRDATEGKPLYALGDGQWDIPALRLLLKTILSDYRVMGVYEVEQAFPGIRPRTVRINARKILSENNSHTTLLLAIEDITERHAAERETKELLEQKEVLLQEIQHRFANSLQIIASILLLKARMVQSEETRLNLQEAHKRIPVGRGCSRAPPRSRGGQANRLGALSHETVRDALRFPDRGYPADLAEGIS